MKTIAFIAVLLAASPSGCNTTPSPSDWDGQLTLNNPAPAECKEEYRYPPGLKKGKAYSRGEAALAYNRLYTHDVSEGQRADRCRVWANAQGY